MFSEFNMKSFYIASLAVILPAPWTDLETVNILNTSSVPSFIPQNETSV